VDTDVVQPSVSKGGLAVHTVLRSPGCDPQLPNGVLGNLPGDLVIPSPLWDARERSSSATGGRRAGFSSGCPSDRFRGTVAERQASSLSANNEAASAGRSREELSESAQELVDQAQVLAG
jgi:hypothetical protein